MFELETQLKTFAGDGPEVNDLIITLSVESAREIADGFRAIRTALRRIVSLGDKNVPKYAKQIAEDGLRLSHSL